MYSHSPGRWIPVRVLYPRALLATIVAGLMGSRKPPGEPGQTQGIEGIEEIEGIEPKAFHGDIPSPAGGGVSPPSTQNRIHISPLRRLSCQ